MTLKDLVIEREYRSFSNDIVRSGFVLVLGMPVKDFRAEVRLSPTTLIEYSKDFIDLLKNICGRDRGA